MGDDVVRAHGKGRPTVINSQSGALGAAAVQIGFSANPARSSALDCGSGVRFGRSYRFRFGLQVVWTDAWRCWSLEVKAVATATALQNGLTVELESALFGLR